MGESQVARALRLLSGSTPYIIRVFYNEVWVLELVELGDNAPSLAYVAAAPSESFEQAVAALYTRALDKGLISPQGGN